MSARAHKRRDVKAVIAAAIVVGTIALTSGCTGTEGRTDTATQVLQTVNVQLSPSGRIQTVDGTAILMNQSTGASQSETTSYQPKDVVNELPVRVTTHYRTADRTGSDLADLAGYTGRVEIDVTLENLTVAPESLTYDAIGTSRTTPALVGTPLSIAASATLAKTPPSTVVFDANSERPTNGVVSARADGGSVVQWGALLAPPQSEATATLRLVADVKDFAAPTFSIAVQVGLHTDLSFTGVLGSALNTGPTSELGMQQNAIELIAQVNDVLTRAGATITEIRKNLEDTSGTLGVRAVQRLTESSRQLTAEMKGLSGQIGSLQQGLSTSVSGTASAMNAELGQIVTVMNAMLGDTTGTAPKVIDGAGCAAITKDSAGDGTVYSMLLYLSALLDGYANVSEGCKTEILNEIAAAIGPQTPDPAACQASASATCALFASRLSVQDSLADLVVQGQRIVSELNADPAKDGLTAHSDVTTALDLIGQEVTKLSIDSKDKKLWNRLLDQTHAAQAATATLSSLRSNLISLRGTLDGGSGSVAQQQRDIATQICALRTTNPTIAQADLDALTAQVTGRDCANNAVPDSSLPANGSLAQRLQSQLGVWDHTIAALDDAAADSPIRALNAALGTLESTITDALALIDDDKFNGQLSAKQMAKILGTVKKSNKAVGDNLAQIQKDQEALGQKILQGFTEASQKADRTVGTDIDHQIDALNNRHTQTAQQLSSSYTSLIDSLRTSAAKTITGGKTLVEDQKKNLSTQQAAATKTLDERTTSALQNIERSTSAATSDLDAATQQLTGSLDKVLLDLGDPKSTGTGILGAMAASAAKSATADFQLAEASQSAAGYANVRDEDISGLMLRQAQFRAALHKASNTGPFHLAIPEGATAQTLYTFRIEEGAK